MSGNSKPWILLMGLWLLACNRTIDPADPHHDSVLAQVNDSQITADHFQKKWSQLPPALRKIYSGSDGRKEFLSELITRELLLQKARQMNLDQDPALVDRVQEYKERLLLDATLRELVNDKINVSDEDIKTYFDAHREELPPIEEAHAAHIVVRTEREAKSILAQLRRGADFAALAKTHSIDAGSKDRGGDLGAIRKGTVIPEIELVVFQLKPGRTSDIVKTPNGFEIIRVKSRQVHRPNTADEVKSEIRKKIETEKEAALFEELVKTLKAESKIAVTDATLGSMGENASSSLDPTAPDRH